MEGLIIGILVALAIWVWMRRRKPASDKDIIGDRPTMPRQGEAGTMTDAQREALVALNFEPHPQWSREEADYILDGVAYLRAVCREEFGDPPPPTEVQNQLLVTILTRDDIRKQAHSWAQGPGVDGEPPARNAQYEDVVERARELRSD